MGNSKSKKKKSKGGGDGGDGDVGSGGVGGKGKKGSTVVSSSGPKKAAPPAAPGHGTTGGGGGGGGGPTGGGAAPPPVPEGENIEVDVGELGGSGARRIGQEDFQLLRVLGRGNFGKVMLVRKKDSGELMAMKTLQKGRLLQRNQIAHTKTERAVLQTVKHPFIVNLNYAFQSKTKLYLITEFASGGELFFWLKRHTIFTEERTRLYAAELILALEHLHERDIVYRDLKPENILLDAEGHIKITDFGLSKEAVTGAGAEGGTKTFCGTPEYLAPEILLAQGHGKSVDWWSLGTLLYECLSGLPPFYDEKMDIMYTNILTAPLKFPTTFSAEAVSLLKGLLQRRVDKRLGSGGAAEIKSHPFFAKLDWDKVLERKYKPKFAPPKPTTGGDTTMNFEEEFTSEVAADSVIPASALSTTATEKTHFEGFTYVPESTIGKSS